VGMGGVLAQAAVRISIAGTAIRRRRRETRADTGRGYMGFLY